MIRVVVMICTSMNWEAMFASVSHNRQERESKERGEGGGIERKEKKDENGDERDRGRNVPHRPSPT